MAGTHPKPLKDGESGRVGPGTNVKVWNLINRHNLCLGQSDLKTDRYSFQEELWTKVGKILEWCMGQGELFAFNSLEIMRSCSGKVSV